jgi:hypothetical protein
MKLSFKREKETKERREGKAREKNQRTYLNHVLFLSLSALSKVSSGTGRGTSSPWCHQLTAGVRSLVHLFPLQVNQHSLYQLLAGTRCLHCHGV